MLPDVCHEEHPPAMHVGNCYRCAMAACASGAFSVAPTDAAILRELDLLRRERDAWREQAINVATEDGTSRATATLVLEGRVRRKVEGVR